MAAQDNPFFIQPASPLQALMQGVAGYDRGLAATKEREISAGRQEAMGALQSGQDPSQALARLIGVGDIQGAGVIAKLHESQQQQLGIYGNPIYTQAPDGSVHLGAMGKRGNFVPIGTPPGHRMMLPQTHLNLGDSFMPQPTRGVVGPAPGGGQPVQQRGQPAIDINSEGIPPSQARRVNEPAQSPAQTVQPTQPSGRIPINVRNRESEEALGQAQGKAKAALPGIVSAVSTSSRLIDEAINHPGRATFTGASGVFDPRNYVWGTDAKSYEARHKQLEGRVFLDAFEQLRGGGAITESEGSKATIAHGRLVRSTTDEEYLGALNELKGILQKGLKVARLKAAGRFEEADAELGAEIPSAPSSGGSNVDAIVKKYLNK